MMERRRALMVQTKSSAGITIADVESGSGMVFNSEKYIVVYKDTDCVTLLRDELLNVSMKMFNTTPSVVDYENSNVDQYLTTTYLSSFSQAQQAYMCNANVLVIMYDGSSSTSKTIQRKICVPRNGELSDTYSKWLPALKEYYGVSTNNDARIAKLSGSANTYWTSDAFPSGTTLQMYYVLTTGGIHRQGVTKTSYIRPLIYLLPTTPVKIESGEYVVDVD